MIVRRISYFTFIVAITTIATVGVCNKASASSANHHASGHSGTIITSGETHEVFDYTLALAKVLREKGLKVGKFRIVISASDNEHVVNVILDKDYKGQVSAKIFDSKGLDYDKNVISLNAPLSRKTKHFTPTFDERNAIARKNRILLE